MIPRLGANISTPSPGWRGGGGEELPVSQCPAAQGGPCWNISGSFPTSRELVLGGVCKPKLAANQGKLRGGVSIKASTFSGKAPFTG